MVRRTRVAFARVAVLVAALLWAGFATAPPAAAAQLPALGPGFRWGVATSGFQSEGDAPPSNWTRYEQRGVTEQPYGSSVDFLHRYREDIARAGALGIGVYRLSIEWARVQPRPGEWDEAGFAFYDSVIHEIVAHRMRPMLTIDHWVYPAWEFDRGGWKNPAMLADWTANAIRVVDRYANVDPVWITINEPAGYLLNEIRHGGVAPGEVPAMLDRLVRAHNAAYDHIHAVQPNAQVSSNVAYIPGAEAALDTQFVDRVADRLDFIGIDYYYGFSVDDPRAIEALTGQLWNAPVQPEGIYYALRYYARKFPARPLWIVENGMPTRDGLPRADGYSRVDHLRDSVYWVQRAVADGMPVVGYNYWSLTDNYEWGSYTPRFGLYTVDVGTDPALQRQPTDAVAAYRAITAHSGVPGDYRPTRAPVPCSLVDIVSSCTEPVTVPAS